MWIKGIAHTAYTVNDIEKSLHFYCGILGMERLFDLELSDCTLTYIKAGGNQFIELFYGNAKGSAQPSPVGYSHLCLEVSDIYALAADLKEKGVQAEGEPSMGLDHNYQLWVTDPDGNRIEFMQYGEDALQFSTR